MTGLIDSVIRLFQAKIRANGARVEQQGDNLLRVMGIAGELRQVMANLPTDSRYATKLVAYRADVAQAKGLPQPENYDTATRRGIS
jgi:C4-dicarboxylate-specific signal transduction histidine kinase